MDNIVPMLHPPFKYSNEVLMGTVAYINRSTSWGVERWIVAATNNAFYFIFCGFNSSFALSSKSSKKALSQSLEELLLDGSSYYRISPGQFNSLALKKSWLGSSVTIVPNDQKKFSLKLKGSQLKQLEDWKNSLQLNFKGSSETGLPVTKEVLYGPSKPPLTEEEIKQEKRRKKTLGFVLLVNAILNIGITILLVSKGYADGQIGSNITPTIIDLFFAFALFAQKDVVKVVRLRAILGLVFWTLLLVGKQDWATVIVQVCFSVYLIYHTTAKPNSKSFKIAMALLVVAAISYAGIFAFSFRTGVSQLKDYNAKLLEQAKNTNAAFTYEEGLVETDTKSYTNYEYIAHNQKIISSAETLGTLLESSVKDLDSGLEKYKDDGSQKNLTSLKNLYTAEISYNRAVLELSRFVVTLDSNNLTEPQKAEYDSKLEKENQAYDSLQTQAKLNKAK
jgi:hypothetical protein